MALLPLLDIARSGLQAQDIALSVTGNNIANVSTPGYSRQRADLADAPGTDLGPGVRIGDGVRVTGIEQIVDALLEQRRRAVSSAAGEADTRRDALGALSSLVNDVGDTGVASSLSAFFDAADALQRNPAGLAERQALLGAAQTLTANLNQRSGDLAAQQRELDQRIVAGVQTVNGQLDQIAALNRQIANVEADGQTKANDLRDQRTQLLNQLAGELPITAIEGSDGTLLVTGGAGVTLVDGGAVVQHLAVQQGAAGLDGNPLHDVGLVAPSGGFIPYPAIASGGQLGGLLGVRDGDLVTASTNLDTFVGALTGAVNAIQTDPAALDLDNNPTTSVPFFSGTTAGTVQVAIADPRQIAAALSAQPGDNQNALHLAGLRTAPQASLGNITLSDMLGAEQARVGSDAANATNAASSRDALSQQIETQRASVSGVSLSDELTNLIQVQHAYQASARLLSVADQVLSDLVSMVS
jgi:flagellar hook-associated protein 1 FlgK